jgi:hypothetical protein
VKKVTLACVAGLCSVAYGCALEQSEGADGLTNATQYDDESDANRATLLDAASAVSWTPVPGGHFCRSTGFSGGQQGVVCNNFYQGRSSGFRVVKSEIELKCGNSAGLLPCTSAMAVGTLDGGRAYTARCVPSGPACPKDGYKVSSPYMILVPSCTSVSATANAAMGSGGFTLPNGNQVFTALTSSVRICP